MAGSIRSSSSKAVIGAALLAVSVQANSFGNSWSLPAPSSPNFIRVANGTLIVPDAPNPIKNEIALWTGMGMSNGDLVQSIVVNQNGDAEGGCGDVGEDWCVSTSTLDKGAGGQSIGNGHGTTYPGDHVTLSYIYNDNTAETDQYAYINGNLVSTYSSSQNAHANGFGTAEECQPGTPCGVMPQHQWSDVAFVLDSADPDFGSKAGGQGYSGGDMSTPDGGVTWYATTITIDQYDFTTGD